jgi:chorismate mutase
MTTALSTANVASPPRLRRVFPNHASIAYANDAGQESKNTNRMAMTEQQQRLAQEREEIATRVANFKATQEKFEREREKYFVTTLENARNKTDRPSFWS